MLGSVWEEGQECGVWGAEREDSRGDRGGPHMVHTGWAESKVDSHLPQLPHIFQPQALGSRSSGGGAGSLARGSLAFRERELFT